MEIKNSTIANGIQFWNATPHTFSSLIQTCRKLFTHSF